MVKYFLAGVMVLLGVGSVQAAPSSSPTPASPPKVTAPSSQKPPALKPEMPPPVLSPMLAGPGEVIPSLGNNHVRSVEEPHVPYNSKPPTSGPHLPNVARWGIYEQQIPNELQVHNLEDGGVMIQYDCKDCGDLVGKLEALVQDYYKMADADPKQGRYKHIIVAPYAGIGSKIALTAWERIEKLDTFDAARIKRFVDAYVGIDHHPTK